MDAPDRPSTAPGSSVAKVRKVDPQLAAHAAEKLAAAAAGSRMLDLMLANLYLDRFRNFDEMAALLQGEGFSWEKIAAALGPDVPPYTAALDAALPHENIVFVLRRTRSGTWIAMHRDAHGQDYMAEAPTEPLARRLAALKALYGPPNAPAEATEARVSEWAFKF